MVQPNQNIERGAKMDTKISLLFVYKNGSVSPSYKVDLSLPKIDNREVTGFGVWELRNTGFISVYTLGRWS